ncbi:unnamed protein product [Vicia faba]|uniref:Legume lectin domain-containing protein n=1 Tax=Vicia faba TaxID=3906 RepID=A0AAV1A0K6_VICFA|nr:unnamed protein product [Vicia faba]
MAFYRTNLPTHEVFSLVSIITILLATNINSVQAHSFNFTNLTLGYSNIIYQGDAHDLASGYLALTNSTQPATTFPTTGRVLFKPPMTLWDNATGRVANFVTNFSFIVEAHDKAAATDGLIFFIAPPDTVIPNNSNSLYLGVVDGKNAINQFVGVEFDLYPNSFDPYMRHIGIDVNSLISMKTEKWNWVSGSLTKATIKYDSPSSTLSAVVTNENGQSITIAQVVDLKTVLPNIVRVGLSATSITGVAHNIHKWSIVADTVTTTSSVSDI